jgi:hypothetical protein
MLRYNYPILVLLSTGQFLLAVIFERSPSFSKFSSKFTTTGLRRSWRVRLPNSTVDCTKCVTGDSGGQVAILQL